MTLTCQCLFIKIDFRFISLKPGGVFLRLRNGPSLVQVMDCRLTGAKSFSEPMLTYCGLKPWKQLQWNVNQNTKISIQENAFKLWSAKWLSFCSGLNTLTVACGTVSWKSLLKWKSRGWFNACFSSVTMMSLLAFCEGNPRVTGGFPSDWPVTLGFDVFFDLRLNKRLKNNRYPDDMRCNSTHHDVTVMILNLCKSDTRW